jgi:hypothetical protein
MQSESDVRRCPSPEAARFRLHEGGLAVFAGELVVGKQATLRADNLTVGEGDRWLLETVRAHGSQALATLFVAVVAFHEGIFFGFPVEAFELISVLGLALVAQSFHVICNTTLILPRVSIGVRTIAVLRVPQSTA